jgi:hypothetical protein
MSGASAALQIVMLVAATYLGMRNPQEDVMSKTPAARQAAIAAATGFADLAGFQLALALGALVGRAAWGGTQMHLPATLRLASALAIPVYGFAAMVVVHRAGAGFRWLPPAIARRGTWVVVVLLTLSAVANLLSPSPWERFLMAPAALVLAGLSLIPATASPSLTGRRPTTRARNEGRVEPSSEPSVVLTNARAAGPGVGRCLGQGPIRVR